MNRIKTWAAVLSVTSPLWLVAALPAQQPSARADEGCGSFTWNLTREFAALKEPATLLPAAADAKVNAARLKEGQHVTATLLPLGSVSFVTPPSRQQQTDSPTGGMLFFKSGAAGHYRISLTSKHWIDILDDGKPIESISHEGRTRCDLLHKAVEFELPANRELVIQLSGDDAATVSMVVTSVAKE